jgi:hypothetical protein
MQGTFALRSGPGLGVNSSAASRHRNVDVPMIPANSPGLPRNGHEGQARPSRFCPGASLVLERLPQERLLSSRGASGESSSVGTRRNPQRYFQCYAWAPTKVPVHAPVPDPVFEEELVLKPLPPQESPADDPRLGNPLARMERVNTSWMGVSCPEHLCISG